MLSASSFEDELELDDDDLLAAPAARDGKRVAASTARVWGRKHFLMVVLIAAAVWSVFAFGVVPKLIADAYDGHGLQFIVRELEHKHAHSLDHYLGKWRRAAVGGLGAIFGVAGILLMTTSRWFARIAVRTATPGTVGAIRVYVCFILGYVMWWTRLREIATLPDAQRGSMGVMNFFYHHLGLVNVVHSVPALQTLKWLCIALCVLGMIGYRTRLVLPLIALMYLPLQGITRSYFWFNHCGLVPWYCLLVLCLSRSADGWSLDRLLKIWRGNPVPRADVATPYYGWVRLAVWLCVCIPYMCAGMSKMRWGTPMWWDANNMQSILFADGLRPGGETLAMKLTWIPGWFFALMGIGTIITEVGFILVPFLRCVRMLWPVSMFGMHIGIWTVMGINFYDLLFIQAIFYDWSPAVAWVSNKLAKLRGTITVLFDGNCPLCRRTVRTLSPMDLFGRLNFIDFRKADLKQLASKNNVQLDPARLDREMVVIRGGKTFGGAQGARVVSGAMPALWIVWPLLALPGLSHIASAVYRKIAGNRMNLLTCDANSTTCDIKLPTPKNTDRPARKPKPVAPAQPTLLATLKRLRAPLGVACMFMVMWSFWAIRLEWYPFTAMQMFAYYNKTTQVSYYRAYAYFEDGSEPMLVKFDKMGGGVARYKNTLEEPFLYTATPQVRERGKVKCVELMARSAKWYNANVAPPGKRIVRMETHHKVWDFVNERNDPNWGKTVEPPIVVTLDQITDTRVASASSSTAR